ncbi:hypothetical protein CMEL01_01019, partial [Colletotrichum melonis]
SEPKRQGGSAVPEPWTSQLRPTACLSLRRSARSTTPPPRCRLVGPICSLCCMICEFLCLLYVQQPVQGVGLFEK